MVIFVSEVGFYDQAWSADPDERTAIAAMVGTIVLHMGVNLWAISALFQKKRSFRVAFVAFWIVSVIEPLSVLLLGFDMHEVVRALRSAIILGFWFLYICLSVRVRNTLVN